MFKNLINPVSVWALLLNFFVLFSAIFLLLLHQNDLPPTVPLWFSQEWGNARLADPSFLWIFPSIIFVFLVFNNLVAKLLIKNHKILALILVWSALIISLTLLFPLYRILLVVI